MRLLIEVPFYDSERQPKAMASIEALDTLGMDVDVKTRYGYGVDAARNRIAAHALTGGYDLLLMVDADITLPTTALAHLVEHDAEVTMGWYLNRHDHGDSARTCLYRPSSRWDYYRAGELRETASMGVHTLRVRGGGMGCCLIRPRVLERLAFPWFVWSDISFNRETGNVHSCGEDIDFCLKCERAGIPIYADTRVECGHGIDA